MIALLARDLPQALRRRCLIVLLLASCGGEQDVTPQPIASGAAAGPAAAGSTGISAPLTTAPCTSDPPPPACGVTSSIASLSPTWPRQDQTCARPLTSTPRRDLVEAGRGVRTGPDPRAA